MYIKSTECKEAAVIQSGLVARIHFFLITPHVFSLPPPLLVIHRLVLSTFSRMNTNSSDEFFQATNHAEQTFRKMETYLQHKQLCDVLLIAGDHKIPAHRLVLLRPALILLITPPSTLHVRKPVRMRFIKLAMQTFRFWSESQFATDFAVKSI